jgi:hypothetical protein
MKIDKKGYIKFYDKVKKVNISLGKSTGIYEQDYKIYSNFNKKFYSENSNLIPKYISYNKKNKLFYVSFKFKEKNFNLGTFHTLEEAKKQLLDFKVFLIT